MTPFLSGSGKFYFDFEKSHDGYMIIDNNLDQDHNFLMFSATFNKEARSLARQHLRQHHIRIRVSRAGSTHSNIDQSVCYPIPLSCIRFAD